MKKIILLISLSFLFTSQGMAAAAAGGAGALYDGDISLKASCTAAPAAPAAKGFLDAYDPEKITPDTFMPTIGPFIGYFIPLLGKSLYSIHHDDHRNRRSWEEKLQKIMEKLQVPTRAFTPEHGDDPAGPDPIPYISHTMASRDFEIAEALYVMKESKPICTTYAQVETNVWKTLQPILDFHKEYTVHLRDLESIVSPQDVTAMDLWVFLTAMSLDVWPNDPLAPRFTKPDTSTARLGDSWVYLTKTFRKLVTAYCLARKA